MVQLAESLFVTCRFFKLPRMHLIADDAHVRSQRRHASFLRSQSRGESIDLIVRPGE
jgi:hypothetical protein